MNFTSFVFGLSSFRLITSFGLFLNPVNLKIRFFKPGARAFLATCACSVQSVSLSSTIPFATAFSVVRTSVSRTALVYKRIFTSLSLPLRLNHMHLNLIGLRMIVRRATQKEEVSTCLRSLVCLCFRLSSYFLLCFRQVIRHWRLRVRSATLALC